MVQGKKKEKEEEQAPTALIQPGDQVLEIGNKVSEEAFVKAWDKNHPEEPQDDLKRQMRIRARTTKMLPMAYKLSEDVVKAWRSYVLEKRGSQLGAGPLLEEILREYLADHGFLPVSEGKA